MLDAFLLNQATLFTLILGRVGGIVATAPLLSSPAAPVRVRALLAAALAFLVLPLQPGGVIDGPLNLANFGRMLASEVIVGLLLGLGLMILLSGTQVAGQLVSQISGMTLGDIFNPELSNTTSVFSQLYYFVTMAVFIAIGGLSYVLEALLNTFEWAPPGRVSLGDSFVEALLALLSQSFELGARAGAPVVIALFLATIILGLISRTLPQINTVAVGFGLNALLTLSVMMLTLGAVALTFQDPLMDALDTLTGAVRAEVSMQHAEAPP